MNQEEQLAAYRKLMGKEATDRQVELNKTLYPCCAQRRDLGHHPLCRTIRGGRGR